ncbi:ATP-binding protein [Bizionia sp. KMM 8389]
MDFKNVYTNSKTYIVLTVIALVLLVFTSIMAYQQVLLMQKSSEMISHSLQTYNGIGLLTTHFTQADSEEFRNQLQKSEKNSVLLKEYKTEGQVLLDSLQDLIKGNPKQVERLFILKGFLYELYDQLEEFDQTSFENNAALNKYRDAQKSIISITLYQMRHVKNDMLKEEQRLMEVRKEAYASNKSITPITLLSLALLALLIFILSFLRIYRNKARIRESENFLKSVLATTDNVVNYYEPIFNEADELVDFRVIFANQCNQDYFGLNPDEMIGLNLLSLFPFLKNTQDFENLKTCYLNNTKVKFDSKINLEGQDMWFHSLVTPLSNGVLITARNSTAEEKAKQIQLNLKRRLENQNLKLLDNRALLANIFKSISHVVLHFKSIRDTNNEVVDFKILFVNEKVSTFTGNSPEQLKDKNLSELYPEFFETAIFKNLIKAIEGNKPSEFVIPYEINGETKWFNVTAIRLGDGVTTTVREVTEEKEKSDELSVLNEQLVIRNSILTDAERIAKIGSFLWYKGEDSIEISDNFYSMLGYESENVVLTVNRFREFIHPDDLELYDLKSKESIEGIISDEYVYRIFTKKGNLKYLKTNGQLITKYDKTFMIGVVQDVTHTVLAAEELRKSNLELQQSNAELESFNRVASHDLQEPLRKIQLFISRIEDLDSYSFSEKSSTYFIKVKSAALRMQALIQNLLAYSRIDSSQTDLEQVDLNEVLEKVQEDLATTIKNTEATITVSKLPNLKGIFFQMEQLFANLMSNALKYKNTTEAPQIDISAKKITADMLPKDVQVMSLQYYQITFSDNGIGFDPKFSEKIFEVFQRLHQKNEYSGTGIGLAICKKIVENHSGYIYATSELGKGTQFKIYLPI